MEQERETRKKTKTMKKDWKKLEWTQRNWKRRVESSLLL